MNFDQNPFRRSERRCMKLSHLILGNVLHFILGVITGLLMALAGVLSWLS